MGYDSLGICAKRVAELTLSFGALFYASSALPMVAENDADRPLEPVSYTSLP